MSNRYIIKFSKDGYVKYTSHLDLIRLFKRTFKKTGISLVYSQGFNPHPKMGFAQPLSLGYSSKGEFIEFETLEPFSTEYILEALKPEMPQGITLLSCSTMIEGVKSLAKETDAAIYKIWIPVEFPSENLTKIEKGYLAQDEIKAFKRQKKSKSLKEINIKNMIREFKLTASKGILQIETCLDCGSQSNCSPELVIASFLEFSKMTIPRYEIEVERSVLVFTKNLQF